MRTRVSRGDSWRGASFLFASYPTSLALASRSALRPRSISSNCIQYNINSEYELFEGGQPARNSVAPRAHGEESSSSSTKDVESYYPWPGEIAPSRWWDNLSNQRKYLDWLGEKLGYKSREAWYSIKKSYFVQHRGYTLLKKYNESPYKVVSAIYTDFEYFPWLFAQTPQFYFKKRENRIKYVNWLVNKLGLKSNLELTIRHFNENAGGGLLQAFGRSPLAVIQSLSEDPNRSSIDALHRKPKGYWSSIKNQRALCDSYGVSIGVQDGDLSPWYDVKWQAFSNLHGTLAKQYSSLFEMLKTVYPDYDWQPRKFKMKPMVLKDDPEFINSILLDIETKLKLFKPEDWYRVSTRQLQKFGYLTLMTKTHGSLFETLKKYRSDFPWDETKFIGVSYYGNSLLGAFLRKLFPNLEILDNHLLADSSSLSVSYYIPSLKIAFDYQKDAYYDLKFASGRRDVSLRPDEEKLKLAKDADITLIFIPFWWDRSVESLIATITSTIADIQKLELLTNTNVVEPDNGSFRPIPTSTTVRLSSWRRRSPSGGAINKGSLSNGGGEIVSK